MVSYIKDNYLGEIDTLIDAQSYMPVDITYRTEPGVAENKEVPVLSGADNIFSDIVLSPDQSLANQKASDFVTQFTRVFVIEKTPDRAYSKFVQNKSELPDVELDWIFQYFRVSFLFSNNDEDYYCITKYDEKTGKYDSSTGPLKRSDYRAVAEEVMQKVR